MTDLPGHAVVNLYCKVVVYLVPSSWERLYIVYNKVQGRKSFKRNENVESVGGRNGVYLFWNETKMWNR